MQKINFQNLPNTTTPINATNLNAIQTNTENAINIYDLFNDTSGNDWQDMMKNKLDYCIANMDSTKTNTSAFVNGGWAGEQYGFGFCSKIGSTYQLIWNCVDAIFYCRYDDNNHTYAYSSYYKHEDSGWQDLTLTSDFSQSGWNNLRYRKINGIVYVIGAINVLASTSWTKTITTLPQGFRPVGELDIICRTSGDQVMKVAISTGGDIQTLNLNDGNQLPANTNIFINYSFVADN